MNAANFDQITGFQWDDGNDRKNVDRHGVSQSESEEIFANIPLLVVYDDSHSQREERFNALGRTASGRLLHLTFTLREGDTLIRVISARDMNRRERERYGQAT